MFPGEMALPSAQTQRPPPKNETVTESLPRFDLGHGIQTLMVNLLQRLHGKLKFLLGGILGLQL